MTGIKVSAVSCLKKYKMIAKYGDFIIFVDSMATNANWIFIYSKFK
jgi:hypothetical protein